MSQVSLKQAQTIIDVALSHGRKTDCLPLGVAILDPGGHLLAFAREDGTSFLRPQISQAKAWGALGMGMGSLGPGEEEEDPNGDDPELDEPVKVGQPIQYTSNTIV